MLEWLKTILGDAYTEELDKKVSEEIGKGFVARTDFNAANEAKKALETQLKERDNQLNELKKMEPEKLQEEITRLQTDNENTRQTYEEKLKTVELNSALDVALMSAKAKEVKAVKPFLDMDLIKLDGEKVVGLEEQLKKLQEEKDFLFDVQSQTSETGNVTVSTGAEHGELLTGNADAFISAAIKAAGLEQK